MHEIKHDGFRIIAVRAGGKVKLFSRRGNDFTDRFPAAVGAIAALKVRSCILDGEAIVVDENGLSTFEICAADTTTMPRCCAPSTSSSSMARICVANGSRCARRPWRGFCATLRLG